MRLTVRSYRALVSLRSYARQLSASPRSCSGAQMREATFADRGEAHPGDLEYDMELVISSSETLRVFINPACELCCLPGTCENEPAPLWRSDD